MGTFCRHLWVRLILLSHLAVLGDVVASMVKQHPIDSRHDHQQVVMGLLENTTSKERSINTDLLDHVNVGLSLSDNYSFKDKSTYHRKLVDPGGQPTQQPSQVCKTNQTTLFYLSYPPPPPPPPPPHLFSFTILSLYYPSPDLYVSSDHYLF